MHPLVKDLWTLLIDTILPVRCACCGKESAEALCSSCISVFSRTTKVQCMVCSKSSPFGLTHPICKARSAPERLVCVFAYTDQHCAESIIVGKYHFVKDVFKVFGKAVAQQLRTSLLLQDAENILITPLPLHKRRKRWRGFNQSEILARAISQELQLPYVDTLTRIRATETQKNLGRNKRELNVAGCFRYIDGVHVQKKLVVLVDDVTTTGSTLKAAATELKKAGAKAVWCVALAQD